MTHVTCRLTAKNRDQLRNPTLGSRVWATFNVIPVAVLYRTIEDDMNNRFMQTTYENSDRDAIKRVGPL